MENQIMVETLRRLLIVTQDCRCDMHEPDEQGIGVVTSGYQLDNALGDNPVNNCGELTIGLIKDGHIEWFNLATLIALARTSRIVDKL